MGSNGEGSQNERSPVTVQVQLKGRSKISIQTELDQTVEQLKQALVDQTGIPSDEQCLIHTGRILSNPDTLRSYEMNLDKDIRLFRIGPASPSTSTGSMSRESTPSTPTDQTYEEGPYKTHPGFINKVSIAKLMKNMPNLSNLADFPDSWADWLESPTVLHTFLLHQLHDTVRRESLNAQSGINIQYEVPKVECMYYAQSGIPHGREKNQFQLGLMGFSFVDTSGKGPESSNSNQSESAPNTEPLPNPWAASSYRGASSSLTERVPDVFIPDHRANFSQTEQVPDSDDDDDDDDDAFMGLSYWQKVHKRSVKILVPIILSDVTLLRHCQEQGRSVGHAYDVMCDAVNNLRLADKAIQLVICDTAVCEEIYDEVFNILDLELAEYIRPILEKLYPIPYIVDYVWGDFNDGVTGATRNVVAPEELFASQLAEMEQKGLVDRRENIIALLSCWGFVEIAVALVLRKSSLVPWGLLR